MTREEAIKNLVAYAYYVDEPMPEEVAKSFDMAIEALRTEVVRCKDCKHRYVSGNGTTQYYVCDFMDAQYEDDGFCHHGKSEAEE